MDNKDLSINNRLLIGRNEWCQLPELHIPAIKAKIDTGAKTSALHAFNIRRVRKNNKKFVRFDMHPLQGDDKTIISCIAPLIDERHIMSSNGHIEHRYVILTTLVIVDEEWSIEVTLSNRDPLRYRLLLGREALNNRVLIDPSLSCHQKKIRRKKAFRLYHP
ncbi:MAG: RimK/LysX family protein [Gammaproteobacteria bacterium]|nr:RimK/LysX family protein [Gammaproteobacteria bacterium]